VSMRNTTSQTQRNGPNCVPNCGEGAVVYTYTGTITADSNGAAFVGNLATGFVVECAYSYDPNSGLPSGKCVTVANPIQ
jgi:hypothetical protein